MAGKWRTVNGKLVVTREYETKCQQRIAFVIAHGQNNDRMPFLRMTRRECIGRSCQWWDSWARHELPKWREKRDIPMSQDPDNEDFCASGVQHGKLWDDLTNVQKVKVATAHFYHWQLQEAGILEEIDTKVERQAKEKKVGATH